MSTVCANSTIPLPTAPLAGAVLTRTPLAIVVPCHNEAESLANLAAAMVRARVALGQKYDVEWLLVDDGSTDQTWLMCQDFFAEQSDVRLLRHETNRGIAAAIATGLAQARADIAASLDADCTYDPLQLAAMLANLGPDVDLVVASPYHPRGEVRGVPAWRLALSRLASRMYRVVLRNKLHTYTSCVRVYRRSSVMDVALANPGFAGIAELVWQLDRRGAKIVECPAVLTVRQTGQSKMRIARATLAHLRLIARAAWDRLFGRAKTSFRRAEAATTT
jgi:dolichol-phosphate mannosyltransferase